MIYYVGFNLTDSARSELLSRFKPSYSNILAHHVTHSYDVSPDTHLPEIKSIRVVGFAKNDDIECVVVEVDGESFRKFDGKRYHITISHNENVKPYQSNVLLSSEGYEPVEHFELDVESVLNVV